MPPDMQKLREIVGNFGTYGPNEYGAIGSPAIPPEEGVMYRWVAIPVDELTDEQVIEVAKQIATEKEASNG